MLSAVIITYNEARNIGRCLDSLAGVADEVVVYDSFSTDETAAICRARGVRFFQHTFDGYGQQKNRAIAAAQFPYILSLDADEALSPELRASILAVKAHWRADGYTMNRLTNYCGRWIRHSGWYPDRKLRLFDARKFTWNSAAVHENLEPAAGARTAHLDGDLFHYSYYTVEEHLERARKYARLGAGALRREGRRATWLHLIVKPLAKFIRNYILKAGFLDGRAGWTICRITALETYWKYRDARKMMP